MAKKVIKLSESELQEMVKSVVQRLLEEGIDVDANGNVFMTDKHEELVDTSVDNNPTLLTDFVPNINVWSIFKRKDDDWADGNPLLYALKGEKGYTLKNPKKFYSRLEYIVKKFFEGNSGLDVTIAVPSKSPLSSYFANIVAKSCQNPKLIDNLLVKMSTGEVEEFVRAEGSAFRKFYGRLYEQQYMNFKRYLRNMDENTFQFHKIEDMDMRKVIEHTIKLANEFYGDYVDSINDKNILIVDETLTLGNTIKESCKIIAEAYTPKSITVLTVFSPLYTDGGATLKKR